MNYVAGNSIEHIVDYSSLYYPNHKARYPLLIVISVRIVSHPKQARARVTAYQ